MQSQEADTKRLCNPAANFFIDLIEHSQTLMRYNASGESMLNITKIFLIAITFCMFFTGCSRIFSTAVNSDLNKPTDDEQISKNYGKAKSIGTIDSNEITESSGITASRCSENVYWTHNDSGGDAFLFAINGKGERLGTWKVTDAKNIDWEDIAAFKDNKGKCFLYLGEIGNNNRTRSEMTIYKVAEPKVSAADKVSSIKKPNKTESAEAIKFSYTDGNHDSETLMIHPQTGEIYVLIKSLVGASEVFKIGKKTEKIADFSVPALPNGLLTGGEISPDGKRVILCDYFNAYEIVLPKEAKNFDEIWQEKPLIIELGERKQGEAICYTADGKAIIATSEKKNSPMIKVERK